ncbi:MAG: DUF167 domain-containing protein [Alphaproteobacteria bacterium]|uniref:UPF0235 protein K8I29_04585 n=1 Tax=Candidatus Nitrobium versatile TaxID=2884831 RepID=A0A953LZE7_9BACT|nr:DUF167 domain-containing protein [Candidatus Nitrobium versatile]
MDIPHSKVKDGIIIEVKVIPKSSRTEMAGVLDGTVVKVKLTAPPVEGAANEQLIAFLAEKFGIKKSDIVILKGETSRRKTVKLSGGIL